MPVPVRAQLRLVPAARRGAPQDARRPRHAGPHLPGRAGQHGVATATACARFGLDCVIYMGAEDVRRQALNVFRIRMLGAQVIPVHSGSCTLKDAVNEALRDWVTNLSNTHYLIGSAIGPHPFPTIVRDFQRVIGQEIKEQLREEVGKLPDAVVACVGGGSNAIGTFYDFIPEKSVRLVGVEAGGEGMINDIVFGIRYLSHLFIQVSMATSTAQRSARVTPVYSTACGRTSCSPTPARSSRRTRSARVSTTPVSDPNMPGSRTPAVPSTRSRPTRRRCAASGCSPSSRASSLVRNRPTPPPLTTVFVFVFVCVHEADGLCMCGVALESSHAIWGGVALAKTLPKDANVVIVRTFLLLFGPGLCRSAVLGRRG